MSILVTGGAGFIGSHVTDALLDAGHEVVVLDDLSGGFVENVSERAKFVEGSILDNELILRLFKKHHFEYVFHLAAYAAEGLSHFIKRFNYHNNLIGSVNLINAAINCDVKCFVFTSSIAVYGENQLPMRESTIPVPEDPYGIAKLAVESDLRSSHEMFGLDYIIFRPHNVYGERQNIGDKYRNVIGIFMNQIMQGKPMTVFGDGEQTRAFSYIADVAPVIAESPFVPGALNEIFNVGADQPYTVNELARVVRQCMGAEADIRHLPARNEVVHAYADHEKVRRVFGDRKTIGLEEGVGRMAEWAKRIGVKSSKEFGEIEIGRNLPPSWT
ncbi:MAG: NAD-dependent epimerase/dehydratase family protein [Phycisphaerales bacterium]|nr:MAG: NAD-dependent epimerase/dehydratase family protein [Phycisphaerales bacterium]